MEDLLMMLPQVFAYLTGMLIAFGAFTAYMLACIMLGAKNAHRGVRKNDAMTLSIISVVTVFLFVSLFISTKITTQFMDVLVVLEFWYASFLYCAHTEYNKACALFEKSIHPPKTPDQTH